MASPNTKKRTLSEVKETDVSTKTGSAAEEKQADTENAVEEIDTLNTFRVYLEAKGNAQKPSKYPFFLQEEIEDVQPSATLDEVLNRVHSILVPESTNKRAEQTRDTIEQIYQSDEPEEEEEELDDDARNALIAKKIQAYLKKELTEIRNAWNAKNYSHVFDVLFATTFEGLAENEPIWTCGPSDSKSEFEETLQGIVDVWSQLLSQADKEFCHEHLSVSDKHFIHVLLESLEKRCKKDNFKCTFHKIKLPTLESLDWPTEQKKYNVTVVMREDLNEESGSESDKSNEEESEDEGEGNEEEEEDDEEDGADENGEVEPPAKKKKT